MAHTRSPEELLSFYAVDPNQGLSETQAAKSREKHGANELPKEESPSLFSLILEQFKDQLIVILLVSAVISFVLAFLEEDDESGTAFVEPIVILLILIANATVGVVQETNAEKAIEALMEYSPDEAKVIRDGKTSRIHAVDIVPGDILLVASGDKIPADCRVIQITSSSFTVDQALLTGESVSVSKYTEAIPDVNAVKQDMVNMLFSGTTVVAGNAKAIVTTTGTQTAIGHIHHSITNQISEKTPLKEKLDDFGDMLAKVISVICILVWLVNIGNFKDPAHHGWLKGAIYYFKIAVALAVAAIPEGLAVVITTCLALGTKKMAKKNAIVRSLPSVETLGCTQVICADKTGTLTTNQMSVSQFFLVQGNDIKEYSVQGTTFSPKGSVCSSNGTRLITPAISSSQLALLSKISALCNDAKVTYDEATGTYSKVGDPTEAALLTLAEKIGTGDEKFDAKLDNMSASERVNAVSERLGKLCPRLLTFEFSRDRKSMSVLVSDNGDDSTSFSSASLLVKGAPETVLERCTTTRTEDGQIVPLTESLRGRMLDQITESGRKGLRNLALAAKLNVDPDASHYRTSSPSEYINFENELCLIGLVGMIDPPRPEVKGAIEKCRTAGIRIIVITGDNKNTAETICRQIGIFGSDEDLTGKSYTGKEFVALPKEHKNLAIQQASLFSRTEPEHKRILVDLLQESGLVVAMTGDGVNDAPALKRAAIGIAMGSGTDVAKLASDMVLADDNFASIELAVEEGRSIYENTKQFIRYLISSNIGEVVSIFLTVLLGMPEALIPVQLLWVNLVTDGLPATALAFSPADHAIMLRAPRNPKEPLVGLGLFIRYLTIGTYVGLATVGGYAWWFLYYAGGPQISFYQLTHFHQCSALYPEIGCEMFTNIMSRRATTVSLSVLVTIEMANAMNSLSEIESLVTLPVWTNLYLVGAIILSMALHFAILYIPAFANLFVVTPLNWEEWKAVLYFSIPVIFIDEAFKYWITHVSGASLNKSTSKSSQSISSSQSASKTKSA